MCSKTKKHIIIFTLAILIIGIEGLTALQFYDTIKLTKYKFDATNLILKERPATGDYVFFEDNRVFKLQTRETRNNKPYAVIKRENADHTTRLPLPCK